MFSQMKPGHGHWLPLRFLKISVAFLLGLLCFGAEPTKYKIGEEIPGLEGKGKIPAEMFSSSSQCGECHVPEDVKWASGFRPHAFNNPFVQAEYRLAWAKAQRDGSGDSLPASCVACHSPTLYLKGIIPKPGGACSKDEEGINCDFCHSTWGYQGAKPGHFNWIFRKGGNRFGPMIQSATGAEMRWIKSPELCGTCHNEKSPGGHWVKSIYDEWAESPYAKRSEKGCLDCHKKFTRDFVNEMVRGCMDLKLEVQGHAKDPARPGEPLEILVTLTNIGAGHKVPAGSVELRQLWLHLDAVDGCGVVHSLRVAPKGMPGEEYTIGSKDLAYRDAMEFSGGVAIAGLPRDGEGIGPGDRIYRLPLLDAQGRLIAFEWNVQSVGPDFRIGPQETVKEWARWNVPEDLPSGVLTIRAVLSYRRVPPALWAFLGFSPHENPVLTVAQKEWAVEIP